MRGICPMEWYHTDSLTPATLTPAAPLVVIEDDPTGVQASRDVPIALEPSTAAIRAALARRPDVIHVLTNSRALDAPAAYDRTAAAVDRVRELAPGARFVLRGDSTLRAHLAPEYRALRDRLGLTAPPLLLVPALPAAGRVTIGGIHHLVTNGRRVPVSETEFARDEAFGYASARLVEWAEERSEGLFAASDGIELGLDRLRGPGGAEALADALAGLATLGRPAVCAPDAETIDDLELISAGLRRAHAAGVPVVVRCAPAFAAVLSGAAATEPVAPPSSARCLVVCGSYTAAATRQLEVLSERFPGPVVELDAACLADDDAARLHAARAAARVDERLRGARLAVLTTPRRHEHGSQQLRARMATALAQAVAQLPPRADVVIAKGGITSATIAHDGLGAAWADVRGPVGAGVSLWRLPADARAEDYIVVPGNVGADDTLAALVQDVLA